jgi:hypothetical protein
MLLRIKNRPTAIALLLALLWMVGVVPAFHACASAAQADGFPTLASASADAHGFHAAAAAHGALCQVCAGITEVQGGLIPSHSRASEPSDARTLNPRSLPCLPRFFPAGTPSRGPPAA